MSEYFKRLFIDEAKAVLIKGSVGGGDVSDSDTATDDEVGDIIDDIFNSDNTGDANPDEGGTGEPDDDNIATDDEVGDVIEDVFGP